MMRQINIPKFKSDPCVTCDEKGELLRTDRAGTVPCPVCKGKGKIKISAKNLLTQFLAPTQDEPTSISQMRKSFKIIDKIESCTDGVIYLEDEEWTWLSGRTDKPRWSANDRKIIAVADAVEQA